jgi:hypothetical protein
MSNVASRPPPRVAPQVYDAIRALLRAGKNDEAIVKLCAIAVIRPDDLDVKELLFDTFFRNATGCRRWPRSWSAAGRTSPACRRR